MPGGLLADRCVALAGGMGARRVLGVGGMAGEERRQARWVRGVRWANGMQGAEGTPQS